MLNPDLTVLATLLKCPPPWLLPYLPLAKQVLAEVPGASVPDALNAARKADASKMRFVAHSALPAGEPYEAFIARTKCIPTRDNLHDVFNGLMWLSYPRTKQRLNELQAEQIAQHGIGSARGALRDALTVFDENAALLQAPAALIDALRRRDWRTLFLAQRHAWSSASLIIFGHALLEKLMRPRKAITAHVWAVDQIDDKSVASTLTAARLTEKLFLPLPVLGVPGWWRANEQPDFYDDAAVFRPPRGLIL